jgi:hypothetical protein
VSDAASWFAFEVTLALPPGIDPCLAWYGGERGVAIDRDQYCPTRDVFEGRLARLVADGERAGFDAAQGALFAAITGEVGNNAFDHNLGHWKDDPGCWFGYAIGGVCVAWVADRGRGVLASLRMTLPALRDHASALETAFQRVVSGRHPERRGNGLKFVRRIVNADPHRGVVAASGTASIHFGGKGPELSASRSWPTAQESGMLVVIAWEMS